MELSSLFQILVTKEYLHLEPIGIVLVFFFSLIIIIQFVAMIFHRFGTISHILASTELNCLWRRREEDVSDQVFCILYSLKTLTGIYFLIILFQDLIERNAVEIVKQMQKLRGKKKKNDEVCFPAI